MTDKLYSPNHSIHISNLKKALAEARYELEKVKRERDEQRQLVKICAEEFGYDGFKLAEDYAKLQQELAKARKDPRHFQNVNCVGNGGKSDGVKSSQNTKSS